jgi:hypothetical protein
MAYSPKLKGMFEVLKKYNNHDLPMIVGGELNLDLRGSHGTEFIEFMRTELFFFFFFILIRNIQSISNDTISIYDKGYR